MPQPDPVPFLRIALRAVGQGLIIMILLPFLIALGVVALGHLAGFCSTDGCEAEATGAAFYAVIPGFLAGALWSVLRDLRSL